jgi:hypothetical protein
MSIPVKVRGVGCASVLLLLCSLAPAASALPVNERELGRWVPSVGFVLGISVNRTEGHLNTGQVLGPQWPVPNLSDPQILPETPATERTNMVTPTFGASFELMTPALQSVAGRSIAGRPRLFGRFDVAYAFGAEYKLPKIGDPGEFTPSAPRPPFTEGTVLGQGGETVISVEPLVLSAGGGLAFTLEAWDRAIRIKPSVEYMRQEVSVSGLVRRAVALAPVHQSVDDFREITLMTQGTQIYHFLGPGLEVDLDAARIGPMTVSPYFALKAWAILDNSKFFQDDSNQWDETAAFTYLPNKWAFGATIGLRLRWAPE